MRFENRRLACCPAAAFLATSSTIVPATSIAVTFSIPSAKRQRSGFVGGGASGSRLR
jgi:hypothetical protein